MHGVQAEDEANPREYEPVTHVPVSIARPVVAQNIPGLQGKHDTCPVRG
jgi:hypothetical protein